jgi:hypothetical protein
MIIRINSMRNAPMRVMALFAAHRVLQSADGVLHFSRGLLGLALSFELRVAEDLPRGYFHRSLACFAEPLIRSLSISTVLAGWVGGEVTAAPTFKFLSGGSLAA